MCHASTPCMVHRDESGRAGQDYRPKNAFPRECDGWLRRLLFHSAHAFNQSQRPAFPAASRSNLPECAGLARTCPRVVVADPTSHGQQDTHKETEDGHASSRPLMLLFIAVLTMLSLAACSSGPSRSAGEGIDDAHHHRPGQGPSSSPRRVSTLTGWTSIPASGP